MVGGEGGVSHEVPFHDTTYIRALSLTRLQKNISHLVLWAQWT